MRPGQGDVARHARDVRPVRVRDLRNLGPVTERELAGIGVTTPDQLDELGAVPAYRALLETGRPPHTMLLWALAGALLDLDWRDLPPELRAGLLAEAAGDPPA